jgi:exosome complex exonuclease DIS3/RRP44
MRFRRHPKPPVTNFEGLNKQLGHYGINLTVETSKALSESLDKAQLSADKYFNNLVRILTTRCMMQAKYFCSGTFSYEDFRHYGLATDIYTHFTSPIRRYADILVHRLLHACIDRSQVMKMPSLFDRLKISDVCENINFRHTMAQQAARSSVELYTNLFFRGKEVVEDGYVIRVLKNGVGVIIPKYVTLIY